MRASIRPGARQFSEEELVQLRGFPEITRDELIRF